MAEMLIIQPCNLNQFTRQTRRLHGRIVLGLLLLNNNYNINNINNNGSGHHNPLPLFTGLRMELHSQKSVQPRNDFHYEEATCIWKTRIH